jgi:hypothetical protein
MLRTTLHSGVIALALSGLLVAASAAVAEMVSFKYEAKASNEVPVVDSKGTGTVEATFDTATKTLSWTITYSGLTGPPLAMHFHGPAEADKNAGIAVPIPGSLASPIKGSATLTDIQATDVMAGRWYINIHTAAFPPGEIRGQMTKVQ